MDNSKKETNEVIVHDDENRTYSKISKCAVCEKRFRSRSHFDCICDLCLADNEMKPYRLYKNFRGFGSVN